MSKTINNITVSEETFNKMILLQERMRRIDAEARLLMIEKAEAEREVNGIMAQIEATAEVKPVTEIAQQVAAVTTPAVV